MAKVNQKGKKAKDQTLKGKVQPWLENKTAVARKLAEHRAARAVGRFGAPAGVALIAFLIFYSLFLPKSRFQLAKERLVKNPQDFEAHLVLAEEYLGNNQVEQAEKELLLAQRTSQTKATLNQENSLVLGEESNLKWEALWQRKVQANPEDIKKLIIYWERITAEKENYRDAYLQLALLHYQLFENKKAQEYLDQVLELDPNFEPARKIKEFL
ncbi:MAG TPA: hypothetical protein VMX77_02495 [Candidatus Bathyarchaeia archaeon]|nr:hypothetical protein [Candidatus Bathyarchaeia archaeon]